MFILQYPWMIILFFDAYAYDLIGEAANLIMSPCHVFTFCQYPSYKYSVLCKYNYIFASINEIIILDSIVIL